MQVVDSLEAGGLETVGVNLFNVLPRHGIESHLCATRAGGPLEQRLRSHEGLLKLRRRGMLGLRPISVFNRYLKAHRVSIVHAHGTALFFCSIALRFNPRCRLVWHDHFGRYLTEIRPAWMYRLALSRASGVIAVNKSLVDWSREKVGFAENRVWYVPNFVPKLDQAKLGSTLAGTPGKRIVCVANLRPEKDHLTLLTAMAQVILAEPEAMLFLAGSTANEIQHQAVRARIESLGLERHVMVLGSRPDVAAIIANCDIGVLSSLSEGLPLAVLEYGRAGLPTIATRVGQIPEVLDNGNAGHLVETSKPEELARMMLGLLQSSEERRRLGERLRSRVQEHYSEESSVSKLKWIYKVLLEPNP